MIVAFILVSVVLVAELVFHAWQLREQARERRFLVNHLLSENPTQFRVLEQASDLGPLAEPKREKFKERDERPTPLGL